MSFTYTTLQDAIKSYLQEFETTFVTTYVPEAIIQAEDRISKAVILPVNRVFVPVSLVSGTPSISTPTGFLAPFNIQISDNTRFYPCDIVDYSYVNTAYPTPSVTGIPKVYSMLNDAAIIFAPTPTTGLSAIVNYFKTPASLTAGGGSGTTWLSLNAPHCLLFGALSEAYTYLKGDPGLQELYENKFQLALKNLKILGENMDLGDAYRMGERRVPA